MDSITILKRANELKTEIQTPINQGKSKMDFIIKCLMNEFNISKETAIYYYFYY